MRLDGDSLRVEIGDGDLRLARGAADEPDAVVATSAAVLRAVVLGGRALADAVHAGDLTAQGEHAAVAHLVTLFPRPAPAPVSTV